MTSNISKGKRRCNTWLLYKYVSAAALQLHFYLSQQKGAESNSNSSKSVKKILEKRNKNNFIIVNSAKLCEMF